MKNIVKMDLHLFFISGPAKGIRITLEPVVQDRIISLEEYEDIAVAARQAWNMTDDLISVSLADPYKTTVKG